MTTCELRPRYDSARVGDVWRRSYVCDVCKVCGYQVQRPFTIHEQLEAGIITGEEAKRLLVRADRRELLLGPGR